jgi:hypothetical protein
LLSELRIKAWSELERRAREGRGEGDYKFVGSTRETRSNSRGIPTTKARSFTPATTRSQFRSNLKQLRKPQKKFKSKIALSVIVQKSNDLFLVCEKIFFDCLHRRTRERRNKNLGDGKINRFLLSGWVAGGAGWLFPHSFEVS